MDDWNPQASSGFRKCRSVAGEGDAARSRVGGRDWIGGMSSWERHDGEAGRVGFVSYVWIFGADRSRAVEELAGRSRGLRQVPVGFLSNA